MVDFKCLESMLPEAVYTGLLDIIPKYKISTLLRLAHFISQCSHESSNFKTTVENLNYSKEGLLNVFPKYFDEESAYIFARKPELIANRVYANRNGNGNEESGDGWKYRGRGFIQLTGKSNYTMYNQLCPDNVLDNPDLVATRYPLDSSAVFWEYNNLNLQADMGNTVDTIKKITKKINGGYNDLEHRVLLFNKYYGVLKNAR